MSAKRYFLLGLVGMWVLSTGFWSGTVDAQEGETDTPHAHHEHQGAVGEETVPVEQPEDHHHAEDGDAAAPTIEHQQNMADLTSEEHAGRHHHRPALLPPDEDKAYSEWNHRVAGVFVLFAGGLALLASVNERKYSWARYGWPGLFFALGLFLFVRHDPESWPWGPLSFWESVTDAQVLQHMLFTLIVLGIGAIEWLRYRGALSHPSWSWVFPSLAVSAAIMLFMHKHGEGPVAEKIYRHHSIMAVSGIIAMIAKVFDDSRSFNSRVPSYVWTVLIMFVGFMLLIYTE